MPENRLDWRNWLFRVFAWDTILPFLIALIPIGIHVLKLNVRAVDLIAVFILAGALLTRSWVGIAYIGSNRCNSWVRILQRIAFFFGIFWLMMLEMAMILSPVNEHFRTFADVAFFVLSYSIYFLLMVIAMYPGRTLEPLNKGLNDTKDWR